MDANHFVPMEKVMQVATIATLTEDQDLVLEAIEKSAKALLNDDKTAVKPTEQLNKRNTIIIRDIPSDSVSQQVPFDILHKTFLFAIKTAPTAMQTTALHARN
jgi:hypothetical protein